MSIPIQSKQVVAQAFSKWKVWRIINTTTILFAFFVPWAVMAKDPYGHDDLTYTGFRMLLFYSGVTKFEMFIQEREWLERLRVAMVMMPYFLGLFSILIYCALNIFVVAITTKIVDKPIWNKLICCLFVLGIINLVHLSGLDHGAWENLSFTLWGYWLVWIGLVSSIALEISLFLSKKTNIKLSI